MLYLVTEFAKNGEIFGKQENYFHVLMHSCVNKDFFGSVIRGLIFLCTCRVKNLSVLNSVSSVSIGFHCLLSFCWGRALALSWDKKSCSFG